MFDILQTIPFIGGFLSVVFPFLIVLGVVVFIHEYGHYIVARWCGIHAEVFSLGFGPVIKSWHDKRGTKWQVSVIPLGGYVKIPGMHRPAPSMPMSWRAALHHTGPAYSPSWDITANPSYKWVTARIESSGTASLQINYSISYRF